MATVLADIGGTHARFAILGKGKIENPEKLAVADFKSFPAALNHYCPRPGDLLIATAAQPDGQNGRWRFLNNGKWVIDPAQLKKAGWGARLIVNDFAASARGAVALRGKNLIAVRKGVAGKGDSRAVIGPGTGLGLAYAVPCGKGGWRVQETMGGHMAAAAVTEEQSGIMALMSRIYGDGRTLVYEDLASGRALPFLYRAVCEFRGCRPKLRSAEDLLAKAKDSSDAKETLRLFHEFLGLFAHNAVVTGHAFGGLYIDGGVTQKLYASGLFDFRRFAAFMELAVAPAVRKRLRQTPVYIVNNPFIALRGLAEMAKDGT
ncbi:MAG: glucokinase [Proteobacteria bacterium]|nr:glucokinase [Pseudomonadota bacterium]